MGLIKEEHGSVFGHTKTQTETTVSEIKQKPNHSRSVPVTLGKMTRSRAEVAAKSMTQAQLNKVKSE